MSKKVLAKSEPPDGDSKARMIAALLAVGWWDCMTIDEREALLERGEILDSPFARAYLLPAAKKCPV